MGCVVVPDMSINLLSRFDPIYAALVDRAQEYYDVKFDVEREIAAAQQQVIEHVA